MKNLDIRLIAFDRLLTIMDELRDKCPWDKKQTEQTLRKLTVEETYELSDAIIEGDWNGIKEELGDILLHIVFYGKIATEQGYFTVDEMINAVCDKLIHRHPHIYSDTIVADEEEVKRNWEKLKLKEGKTSILQGVPQSMPALVKAQRIQDKVRQIGFDWDNSAQVWNKCLEEIEELKEAIQLKNQVHIEEEFGDMMFAMVNYARFIEVDAELALEKANKKFMKRFKWMEIYAKENNLDMHNMNLEGLDKIWDLAKVATK
jgi:MazG family protein